MAMSLADEMGGALDLDFDPHRNDGLGGNAGLGLSLADELELDLELDHEHNHEYNHPSAPSGNNQYLSSSPPKPHGKLTKSPSGGRMRDTPRRARTSAASTYYTATASPGRLSGMDSADEIDQALYQLEEDRSLDSDTSERDDGSVPDLEVDGNESRDSLFSINGAGLPTPKMDEDDIAAMQDEVADIARFVNSLRKIEPEPVLESELLPAAPIDLDLSYSLNRSRPGSNGHGSKAGQGVLESYLDTVDKTGKASEVQAKELSNIRKVFASAPPTPELINGLMDVLGPIDSIVEDSSIQDGKPPLGVISEETTHDEQDNLSTLNPDESFITAHDPEASTVTETIQEIISENKSLISDLRSLKESVNLNQSIQTSTTRQIKGLKSTLMTWEEREAMEERAKVAIEEWERSQVQRGLRGEKGTREILDDVQKGFREALEEAERRMQEVRAKYAVTAL